MSDDLLRSLNASSGILYDARGKEIDGNGESLTARQNAKLLKQYVTMEEANAIAYEHVRRALDWYGRQVPGVVARMLGEALALHGIELKVPDDDVVAAATDPSGDGATVEGNVVSIPEASP